MKVLDTKPCSSFLSSCLPGGQQRAHLSLNMEVTCSNLGRIVFWWLSCFKNSFCSCFQKEKLVTIKGTDTFESHKVTVLDSLLPSCTSSLLLIQCATLFMHMSSGPCWWAAVKLLSPLHSDVRSIFFFFLQKMRCPEKMIPAKLLCFDLLLGSKILHISSLKLVYIYILS